MTTSVLMIHCFSKTCSAVQKCRLRRLINENTRKTTWDLVAFHVSSKMEMISCKGMLHMKTLAKNCLKSFQLLNNAHKEQPSKIWLIRLLYSKSRAGCLKRVRLDAERAFKQVSLSFEASYVVALRIAKAKKSWDFAELVQPCLRNCAKIVLDDRACNTLKQASPSNDTIKIFTNDPRSEMLVKWKQSQKAHLN